MTASTPFTSSGRKYPDFIEDPQEMGEAIAEAADLLAPFVPLASAQIAPVLARLVEKLRTGEA